MKRSPFFLVFKLVMVLISNGQVREFPCLPLIPKICYNNATSFPPVSWQIDGQLTDWLSILGNGTGNATFPYSPPALSVLNWFHDGGAGGDLDQPDPVRNMRFFADICDNYNYYFYFRRMAAGNAQNSFLYFFDVNNDGFLGEGEPVIRADFKSNSVSSLSIGKYIPDTRMDYETGKGNYMVALPSAPVGARGYADGYTVKGRVEEIFSSNAIPSTNELGPHEIFSAAITENGLGIEFAVPRKFFKNWVTDINYSSFTSYHVALITGAGEYVPGKVADNAGYSEDYVKPLSASVSALVTGLSYRYNLKYENLKNLRVLLNLHDVVFKNIQNVSGLTVDPGQFVITVYRDLNNNGVIDTGELPQFYNYYTGTFQQQPITFYNNWLYLAGAAIEIPAFGTAGFIVDITLPANHSVKSTSIEFETGFAVWLPATDDYDRYCGAGGGGGKPINPIGFDLETESSVIAAARERNAGYTQIESEVTKVIRIYPNPTHQNATVILPQVSGTYDISVEDITGKTIRKWNNLSPGNVQIHDLKTGIYIVRILSCLDGKQTVKKLIVQ